MIQNQPSNLDAQMSAYAQSFVRNNTCEDDYQKCFTCRAEFLEWSDTPERWAGAWADEFVLALVYDHSMTEVRSLEETLAAHSTYSKYN